MNRWPTKPLGEVCIINPRLAISEIPAANSEVTFVPMAAVDEVSGSIAQPELRHYSQVAKGYTPFRENDVLFAKITPCMQNGKAAIARNLRGGIGFGSTEFHVLRPTAALLPQWVFAFIRQPSFRSAAEANFTGTAGQQRVPADFLKKLPIPVPPMAEQGRIVKLLDDADGLRKLRGQADRRAAEFIPALFHEMFGENKHRTLERTELEQIAEVVSGVAKGRKFNGRQPIEVPYLRVANVQAGHRDLSEIKTIQALPEEAEALALRKGDVLLTEGGDFDKLGRGAMLEQDLPNCIHQNHVFRVRAKQSKLEPVYFAKFLLTAEARRYFLGCAKRTTNLASINMTQLRALPVPVPPLPLQNEFAERVAEIRTMEAAQAAGRNRLDDLFQSLLHRAFRSEL